MHKVIHGVMHIVKTLDGNFALELTVLIDLNTAPSHLNASFHVQSKTKRQNNF